MRYSWIVGVVGRHENVLNRQTEFYELLMVYSVKKVEVGSLMVVINRLLMPSSIVNISDVQPHTS